MNSSANAINNTFQILEEFSQKSKAYHPPLPRKMQRVFHRGRSGKVKIYTEEERFLYCLKNCPIQMDI
jgi:hypothetical protein